MKKNLSILLICLLVIISLAGCVAKDEKEIREVTAAIVDTNDPSVNDSKKAAEVDTKETTESTSLTEKAEVTLNEGETVKRDLPTLADLVYEKSLDLQYATAFEVDYYEDGYIVLTIEEINRYLIVPENQPIPEGLEDSISLIQRPIQGLYVANAPTMSYINGIDALNQVTYTGTEIDQWYIDEIVSAMETNDLAFAGKYKEPDYELLLAGNCNLVIESAMINNCPEVTDKFKELEIPMMIDRSGEEAHPLGKVEWLKLYSALLDSDMTIANSRFQEQVTIVEALNQTEMTDKTVAIFFITSKGKLYARNTDDYLTKMTELAGGKYIFTELDNTGSNSTTMEMEAFYETAKEADHIIYIYSIGGKPETLEELVGKNELLKDFKAVKEGHVWATCPEFFQMSNVIGNMVDDIHTVLTSDEADIKLDYLFELK